MEGKTTNLEMNMKTVPLVSLHTQTQASLPRSAMAPLGVLGSEGKNLENLTEKLGGQDLLTVH